MILDAARSTLGPNYDVATHFTPRYDPWDQRLCLAPNGDFFHAIRSGKTTIVTDEIETFTKTGLKLRSGRELSKIDIQSGLTHAALLLQQQIAAANKGIYEAAQTRPECAGMGTTIVAAVFHGNRVSIGHIGDSRCYRLRGEKFEQLTHDHSLLQEQIDSGQLTAEQAKYSLNKNLVTRALGIEAIVPADIAEYRLEADDVYLLCSDGLTDMVDPDVVQGVVDDKRTELAQAAAELVDLANQNGGRDNISVILVRVPADFLPASGWVQRWLAKKTA